MNPSGEANSPSASQGTDCMLCNPKVHYRVYRNPSFVPILSQINPVHSFPFYSCTPLPTAAAADHFDAVTKCVVVFVVVVVGVAFWQCRQAGNRTFISRSFRKYRPFACSLAAARTQALLQ